MDNLNNYEKYIITLGNTGENILSYSFPSTSNREAVSYSGFGSDFQKYFIPKALVLTKEELNKIIDARVEQRMKELLINNSSLRKLTDIKAKFEVSRYVLSLKKKGVSSVSLFNIARNLNIPVEQVEKVMRRFVKLKKVKEL
ncbi:MAG TPA: hypothetical protein VJ046_00035 [Candidatus Paceibacterota bacterium]|nr:hypothetical protein [Candidatus Paceibacterota bacterium]